MKTNKTQTQTNNITELPANVKCLGESGSFMLFGPNNSTMVPNMKYSLDVGTRILAVGAGCSEEWFVVFSSDEKGMKAVKMAPMDYNKEGLDEFDLGGYYSAIQNIRFDEIRPLSQRFGIGLYFDESGEIVEQDIIDLSLQRANDLQELEDKVAQKQDKATEELREKYEKEYDFLTPNPKNEHKTTGNNIRAELKRNFPGVKFSVRYSSFSGGDSYDVSWYDGPTSEEVNAIVGKYQDHHTDWTGDYHDYLPSLFNKMFGGVSFARGQRSISQDTRDKIKQEFSWLTDENKCSCNNEEVRKAMYSRSNATISEILLNIAYSRSYYTPPVANSGAGEAAEIETRDYVIILGNSKPIKEALKAMGATFSPKLSCGAGWTLPANKKDEALALSKEITSLNIVALFGDTKAVRHELKAMGAVYSPYLADGAGWVSTIDKLDEIQKLIKP